jgi:AcrR family transcriptional regulator
MTKPASPKPTPHARAALLRAFGDLVTTRRYSELRIGDIVERAGVGRSTFYEHFSGKDGILAASIRGPFSALVDSTVRSANTAELVALLEHFWHNRAIARGVFMGPVRAKVSAVLAQMIEQQLDAAGKGRATRLLIPARLVAAQLAESLLAPITAWLTGVAHCPAITLADALIATTGATLDALRQRS